MLSKILQLNINFGLILEYEKVKNTCDMHQVAIIFYSMLKKGRNKRTSERRMSSYCLTLKLFWGRQVK